MIRYFFDLLSIAFLFFLVKYKPTMTSIGLSVLKPGVWRYGCLSLGFDDLPW